AVELALVVHLYVDQPALAVRVGVDQVRLVGQPLVDRRHRAGHRRVQVADALGGLQLAARVARPHRGPYLGQLDEHDVTELVLGVVGNPDPGGTVARRLHPLVLGRVLQIFGVHRRPLSFRPPEAGGWIVSTGWGDYFGGLAAGGA